VFKMGYYKEPEPEDKELLYDLRQAFVIITTEIKKEIVLARTEKDFSRWYTLIDSLFIEVSKNLSEKEVDEYEKMNNNAATELSKYSLSFLKKSNTNSNEVYAIIRKLDLWINRKMNERNMYGSKDADDGL